MIDRHDKNCNLKDYRRKSEGCNCGVSNGDPHYYKFRLAICERLLVGYTKCSHYQVFNKRLEKSFESALWGIEKPPLKSPGQGELTLRIRPKQERYETDQIHVWGNNLSYNDGVTIYLREDEGQDNSWQERFKRALKRERESLEQAIENIVIEDKIAPSLSEDERHIKNRIQEARLYAEVKIHQPSADLIEAFPLIFKTDIDK